jgi:hypothetical protein
MACDGLFPLVNFATLDKRFLSTLQIVEYNDVFNSLQNIMEPGSISY